MSNPQTSYTVGGVDLSNIFLPMSFKNGSSSFNGLSITSSPITASGITYPISNANAIGYYNSIGSTITFNPSSAIVSLASVTIPCPGVWIVEGQFTFLSPYQPVLYTQLSLSLTSIALDSTRTDTKNQNGASGGYASHITSIFNISNSTTTIYLMGQAGSSNAGQLVQKNVLSITRIA